MMLPNSLDLVLEFKKTIFYKEFVESVYVCAEMPNTLWFKAKKAYTKRDEITLWNELEHTDIDVIDVAFQTSEVLKEI